MAKENVIKINTETFTSGYDEVSSITLPFPTVKSKNQALNNRL